MQHTKPLVQNSRFSKFLLSVSLIVLTLMPVGCENDPTTPIVEDPSGGQIDDIQVHGGYLGLVFDTREIFRKGYTATSVELDFEGHSERNVTLPVDPTTNLAILSLDTDSLTTDEEEAFTEGVVLSITVLGPNQETLLTRAEDSIKLENTNQAMVLNTSGPAAAPLIALRNDLPYVIQVEGNNGVLLNFSDNNSAASFEDVGVEFPGINDERGSVVWGDYDVDGDLDILVGGGGSAQVFRNDHGTFTNIGAPLPQLFQATLDWGDFDNDYDLDILITGVDSDLGKVSRVYRNVGGNFVQYEGADLMGLSLGSADWGDYDNDGDLDILITGTNSGRYVLVYRNNNGIFENISADLPGVHYGTAAWGDYDGDNDLDILLAGGTIGDDICQLYRNDNGDFNHVTAAVFETPPAYPYVDWADYDNDGDLDFLITGNGKTLVYRNNNGDGTFLEMGVGLDGGGSAVWGDFDNDEDLDIVLANGTHCQIYRNDAQQGFTPIQETLPANTRSICAWGDFDNNGAVDILLGSSDVTRIYRADPGAGFNANSEFEPDNLNQEFLFVPVEGMENTYTMLKAGEVEGRCWCLIEATGYLKYQLPDPANGEPAAQLEALGNDDGWMQLRIAGTETYLTCTDGVVNRLATTDGEPTRLRLLSANIDWMVADRGTVFNQPIMPPARLDFAYQGTLRNCSSATFEEVIGRSEERTSTTTMGTTESLHLFSSRSSNLQITVGYEVKAKVGLGVETEITQSAQLEVGHEWTSSRTAISENTWSTVESTVIEVSRVRTLALEPYSAVEVFDAVKTINNVRVPYTQVLRISATNIDTGLPLTGLEIRSQMLFNFVGGVITAVEDEFIDIGFRGEVIIDQLMHATVNIDEMEGACD